MKKILPILIVAILAGGISFYGGTVFAKKQAPAQTPARQGAAGAAGAAGRAFGGQGRNGGGFVSGKVVSKDVTSITIQLDAPQNGQAGSGATGSKIVFYSPSTTVSQMTQGTMDSVTSGTDVTVIGQTGTDGSVTAQSIQIRPAGMPFGRGSLPAQGQPQNGTPNGQPNGQ